MSTRVSRSAVAMALAVATLGAAPPVPSARAHYAISTTNTTAQTAFDDGLAMLYAFDIGQARVRFAAAAAADPTCAMAYWGAAVAETIDINLPQTDQGDKRGAAAIAKAQAHLDRASPQERALIVALASRFAAKATTAGRFRSYADAMARVAAGSPGDADVLTLAAFARWNDAGHLVDDDGRPKPAALEMQRELDAALAIEPNHLGAHHLRIHLEEEIGRSVDALSDAQAFDAMTFAPGMSHLPHMAGHIYARLGDYDAVIASNERAVRNDAAFFALGDGDGQTYMRTYHDHDLDFVGYGLTTEGRDREARAVMENEDVRMKLRVAIRTRDPSALELAVAAKNAPLQAIAFARSGRIAQADALVRAFPPNGDDEDRLVHTIARAIVARAHHDLTASETAYRAARQLVGEDLGDPKTAWAIPVGEGLGAVLLERGRFVDAERTFRDELARYPNDPRLAFGLAEALRGQGKDDTAPRATAARDWQGAPLTVEALG